MMTIVVAYMILITFGMYLNLALLILTIQLIKNVLISLRLMIKHVDNSDLAGA